MGVGWAIHSIRQATLNAGGGARDGRSREIATGMGRLGGVIRWI